jgi:hypothetical protein
MSAPLRPIWNAYIKEEQLDFILTKAATKRT